MEGGGERESFPTGSSNFHGPPKGEPVNPNVDRTCISRRAHTSVCCTIVVIRVFAYQHASQALSRVLQEARRRISFFSLRKRDGGEESQTRHLQCKRCGDVSNICRQKVALLARRLMVMMVMMMKLVLLLRLLRLMLLLVRMVLKGRLGGGRVARRHQIIRLIEQLRLCLRRCASGRE